MNKIIIVFILLTVFSCEQNPTTVITDRPNGTSISNIENKNEIDSSTIEKNKYITFNENIDTIPKSLNEFIPAGYSVLNISTGDVNLDGLIDNILVLRKNTEEATSNYAEDKPNKRPLLILLGQLDNSFKLFMRNDNAVYCIDCGGIFGDPFSRTTITNGYFTIEHSISGGQHWNQIKTFKYDKLKKNWVLFKDRFVSYKQNDSDDPNAEAIIIDVDKTKTVADFGVVPFDKFNIYKED